MKTYFSSKFNKTEAVETAQWAKYFAVKTQRQECDPQEPCKSRDMSVPGDHQVV